MHPVYEDGGTYWVRGKRSIDYPAQGNPYNTPPPSERGGIFGASVQHTAVRWPIRFVSIPTWGTRETYMPFRNRTRKRFYKETKETFKASFEPVSSTTSNKCEGVTYYITGDHS